MKSYNIRQAIAVAALSATATVLLLEYYGYIRHTNGQPEATAAFYAVAPIAGKSFRMSDKLSPHRLNCVDNFAMVITDAGAGGYRQSLLVDGRNRGLPCSNTSAPTTAETRPAH